MNDFETRTPDILDTYLDLDNKRSQLAELAASASDGTADLYARSVENATKRLDGMRSTPEFESVVRAIGEPIVKTLAELKGLQSAVEMGLIDESVIEERRKNLLTAAERDPRTKFALASYVGKSVVPKIVETPITIKAEDDGVGVPIIITSSVEKAPTTPTPITITLLDNAVSIGERGKYILTSNRRYDTQRDYSKERIAVLETLVQNQGKEMTITDLWEASFPGMEIDKGVMVEVRRWLTQLTYRRQPIVEHNGKRSVASAYSIPNFLVTLIKKQVTKPPVITRPAVEELPGITAGSIPKTAEVVPTPTTKFRLKPYDCLLLGEFININKDILERLDIKAVPERVLDDLRLFETEGDHGLIINEHGTLQQARRDIIKTLQAYFNDENTVLETIVEMSPKDIRYEIFSYLFDIDGQDRWELLNQIVDAGRKEVVKIDTTRNASYRVTAVKTTLEGVSFPDEILDPAQLSVTFSALPAEDQKTLIGALESLVEVDNPLNNYVAPALIVINDVVRTPETAVSWEVGFRKSVGEAINMLHADGLLDPTSTISGKLVSAKSSSKKMGTKEAYDRLIQAGIVRRSRNRGINRPDIQLTSLDLIAMSVFNANSQVLGKGPQQKRALAIIADATAKFFENQSKGAN